jgi:hypothetical protein
VTTAESTGTRLNTTGKLPVQETAGDEELETGVLGFETLCEEIFLGSCG